MTTATADTRPTAAEILASPPKTLHRHETDGHLGGAIYAQPFARYLSVAIADQRAVDDGYHADWWRNAYLAARLKAQMLCYPLGGRAYLAILAMDRGGMSETEAARRCGQSAMWLKHMLARFDLLKCEYQRKGARRRERRLLSA